MRAICIFLFCFSAFNLSHAANQAKHVVLVVWDGMRPDFVSESNTPTLHALARRGVFFANNHSVYLSSTEVNGTALATGAYPQRSRIIANKEFRPDIDSTKPVAMESLDSIRRGDEHESYLAVPTLAETLQKNGYRTAIAGSKPVVLLQDRAARPDNAANVLLYEGRTLPASKLRSVEKILGPLPPTTDTKTNRDLWTTRALLGPLWENGVPEFSLLWLAEPDNSQHATGVGSPRALAAIRNSDYALSLVIDALKQKGVYDSTDVFVVSDHGFSSITRNVNVAAELQQAGFNAVREFKSKPAKGDVLIVGLGGSALLYVTGHDTGTINRIIAFLQTQNYVGVILSRTPHKGTFPLTTAFIGSKDAPDIAFSFSWTAETNRYAAPGELISDGQGTSNPSSGPGLKGTHVSLSRFDLHNTLIAAGPDIRGGLVSEVASGNVDVAPTILHVLGVKPRSQMDGRVLFEALNEKSKLPKIAHRDLQARGKVNGGIWMQQLSVTDVNGVRYLDEGNGKFVPSEAPR